jgi:hypothetical protein
MCRCGRVGTVRPLHACCPVSPPQALLYLVPCTVIPFIVQAKCRGELPSVWNGKPGGVEYIAQVDEVELPLATAAVSGSMCVCVCVCVCVCCVDVFVVLRRVLCVVWVVCVFGCVSSVLVKWLVRAPTLNALIRDINCTAEWQLERR